MKNCKIRSFLFCFAGALLLGTGALQAQTEPSALTWENCVKEATAHNRDLLTAEQTLKATEDTKTATLGQFFPQVSFSANTSRSGSGGFNDAFSPPDSPYLGQSAGYSFKASQDIFSGFTDFASVDQANANLDNARAELTQAKSQLSHDLKSAFYTLLFSQQQIDLLKSIRDRDKANADLVQMNYSGGTDNKGSLMQAQASVTQDGFSIEQATLSLRVAQRQLDQVLGRNPMEDVVVQGNFDAPTLPDQLPDFVALTNQTPAHWEAVAQLHIAESQYVTARGAFFPTISANASLGQQNAPLGWSAGLELSLPLFTGGKDLFTLKSAEESKQGSQDSLESSDLKTEYSLENDYASYKEAVDEISVQQFQVQATQVQEQVAKVEYLNGLIIFVDWNVVETNLSTQQKNLLSDLLAAKTAEANWELAEGKGDIP